MSRDPRLELGHRTGSILQMMLDRRLQNGRYIRAESFVDYRFCQNSGLDHYDCVGERTCWSIAAEVAALSAQIVALNAQIAALSALSSAALFDIGAATLLVGSLEPGRFVADFNLKACLSKKERDPCVDCTNEEAVLATFDQMISDIENQIDLLENEMIDNAWKIGELAAQATILADKVSDLGSQPCTWF